jgi:DNA-binding protein H-NS
MPKTYSQLMDEIQALQARADELKQSEVRGVIARIKEAIAAYGLSPADLFGSGRRKAGASGPSRAPRYADGKGNVWGGRGPRPRWLRDALASGKKLSDFETRNRSGVGLAAAPKTRKAAPKKKRGGTVKYRDDAGHSWSGFGPKPGWFKQALAAGKTPESMAV